ncbi:ATP-binding protein [Planotetraspora mira]|uniref:ATP-binding protein n=2 Tax=Planotetraspora mira TaxID=58121 RepID=A0A8J3TQ94_9ACTN|nr:ATP-binding protein [Planotetraspora mira]
MKTRVRGIGALATLTVMIIWLNGTFGAGKTSTAKELVSLIPEAHYFDPEQVGFMLRHISGLPEVGDFQHWRPWRGLVVETASQVLKYVGGVLVMPQSVLVEQYWEEIRTGLREAGIPLRHFVLHADEITLTQRIESDVVDIGARQWRLDHLPKYRESFTWLSREGEVIDTAAVSPSEVAKDIAAAIDPTL